MKAKQLYYTSCRIGLSGQSGFQIRSMTPGILPEDQEEIIRLGNYKHPRNASREIDAENLGQSPRAFRLYRLASGQYALSLSCHAGRDDGGRWGNYFAHTLVFPERLHGWPIDFFEWRSWRHRLTPDESRQKPEPLPEIDLTGCSPAPSFSLDELRDFLQEQEDRPKLLEWMLRAVFLGQQNSRYLVIRDEPLNAPFWIACIQKAFPSAHAWSLTYSTYQYDGLRIAQVNATTGQTGFKFDFEEKERRFYIFDFDQDQHAKAHGEHGDYPSLVSEWLTNQTERMQRFHRFAEGFKHQSIDDGLLSLARLFLCAERAETDFSSEDFRAMIDFAEQYVNDRDRRLLFDVFQKEAPGGGMDPKAQEQLLRFLARSALKTNRSQDRRMVFEKWLRLFSTQIKVETEIDAIRSGIKHVETCFHQHDRALAVLFLDHVSTDAPMLLPDVLVFLLDRTLQYTRHIDPYPLIKSPHVARILHALIHRKELPGKKLLSFILDGLANRTADQIAVVCVLLARERQATTAPGHIYQEQVVVGRQLAFWLEKCQPPFPNHVRKHLEKFEAWDILLGAECIALKTATSSTESFMAYWKDLKKTLPDFHRSRADALFSRVRNKIFIEDTRADEMIWIRNGLIEDLSEVGAESLLKTANRSLALGTATEPDEETCRLVTKTARKLGIDLSPDWPFLRGVLRWAVDIQSEPQLEDLDQLPGALAGIETEDYQNFLSDFLDPALEKSENVFEHQRMIEAVQKKGQEHVFGLNYLEWLEKRRKKALWPLCMGASLRYWLTYQPGARNPFQSLQQRALEVLGRHLIKIKKKDYRVLLITVEEYWRLDGPASHLWHLLKSRVDRRRKGFRGIFRR